jgi:hypothetical protein
MMISPMQSWTILMTATLMFLQLAGCAPSLKITKPVANATVNSPVEVCFDIHGLKVQAAKKGVEAGTGHHHILVDIPQPEDFSLPIPKGEGHLHMGDGSHCKKVKLDPGLHTLQAVFADGNHVPVKPPLTTAITVVVKE